jgi:hypothetical protein
MKYIKGVNMNMDDKAYLKSHFEEEDGQGNHHGISAVIAPGGDQN